MNRRELLQSGIGCAAMLALGVDAPEAKGAVPLPKPADAFTPLQLGEVMPAGWLETQLRTQANGMGGHLDEFWPDVGSNSGWIGGTGESWERGPYFVDGLYPLAVLLNDAGLRAKAMRFIDWTLEHPQPNGMIGPTSNDDWWPRMVMLKVLAQYHDATSDPRVISILTKYFHYQLSALPGRPLASWGKYRWQDEAFVVTWLYRKTGDPELPKLFSLLQQQGFDWVAEFRDFPFKVPQTRELLKMTKGADNAPDGMATHGVNNGQALKTAAVRFQRNGDPAERENFNRQIEELYRYHGHPNGMFSCDEHLAGLSPSQGTELCTVVETMFSLEIALCAFGDPALGDRLEMIAFNALPGTFTDDMWAHQYDQQPNQVRVSRNSKPWTTNGPESNLYGLEPNFGCCTANFHQGWPKLTTSLWMRSSGDGLAAAVWAPCVVDTKVKTSRVKLSVATEYPFRDSATIHIEAAGHETFPLHLRIPAWSGETRVLVNGSPATEPVQAGTFFTLRRAWKAGDTVEVHFAMKPFLTRGFRDSVTVHRGPLVFSHSPGELWSKLRERGPTADWQVFGKGAWNYALAVNDGNVATLEVAESPMGTRPFAAENCGVKVQVPARRLTSWSDVDGVAAPVPQSPVTSTEPLEHLQLLPYAAAKLRITAFPTMET